MTQSLASGNARIIADNRFCPSMQRKRSGPEGVEEEEEVIEENSEGEIEMLNNSLVGRTDGWRDNKNSGLSNPIDMAPSSVLMK